MGLAKDSSCSELPPDAAHPVDDLLGLNDFAACHATIRLVVRVWNALVMLVAYLLLRLGKETYPFALHLAAKAGCHLSGFAGLLSLCGR